MQLDDALKNVSVIGAAGKMGSGISLLLLQEMARCEAEKTGRVGGGTYCLTLIDANEHARMGLRQYLRSQLLKYAEKNINSLRQFFAKTPNLVSNEEIIRAFVEGGLDNVRFETEIDKAKESFLVFEAVLEDISAKTDLFNTLKTVKWQEQYYFTNTSSIPISFLDNSCQLDHRIIGFHFYNPPAIQKIIEFVSLPNTDPDMHQLALELAKRLDKKVIKAHDIAGFIGNGCLMREIVYACQQVKKLSIEHKIPTAKAIYFINRMTQDYLLRPMGIFQLIDYIGIDVCHNIAMIMSTYLPDPNILADLVEAMENANVHGGQFADGQQKNGFFQYERHGLVGIYLLEERRYVRLNETRWEKDWMAFFEALPDRDLSWKSLQQDPLKKDKIKKHLQWLHTSKSKDARLANDYLMRVKSIAKHLVKDGIADNLTDVDNVLQFGFLHPYGTEEIS